jgi:hypothetical protein
MLLADQFLRIRHWPTPLSQVRDVIYSLRSFNNYGLFAVMTTKRPEIIVEGSNDGRTWSPYEFKWKPGTVERRPVFTGLHLPRLDWQMWFAALDNKRQSRWLANFVVRLWQGSPAVVSLLETNPFPDRPPRYIRAQLYEYHFTDAAARARTGAWWQRKLQGTLLSLPLGARAASPN